MPRFGSHKSPITFTTPNREVAKSAPCGQPANCYDSKHYMYVRSLPREKAGALFPLPARLFMDNSMPAVTANVKAPVCTNGWSVLDKTYAKTPLPNCRKSKQPNGFLPEAVRCAKGF